jgi:hypothetical protein
MSFFSLTDEMKEKVIKSMEKRTPKGLSRNQCWIWEGRTNMNGYGELTVSAKGAKFGTRFLAHRLAWEMHWKLPIPPKLFCCHTCDVRDCVNAEHLVLGTAKTNALDMMNKDRKMKVKRHVRLAVADTIVGGKSIDEAAAIHKLPRATTWNCLRCSEVRAKYGRIDLTGRRGIKKRELWTIKLCPL